MEIFTRKWSEISGGRFDADYYQDSIFKFANQLKRLDFHKMKGVILESSYGTLPPSDCYNNSNPITFIRATELEENLQIDFQNAPKVPQTFLLPRNTLKKNDILIAVKGATIASKKSIAFVDKEINNTIFNGSIFRIRVDSNKIIPKALAHILDSSILKRQCKANLIANNGVDYLDKNVLNNLLIPLPSKEIQRQIIDIMDKAYLEKRRKGSEARVILDSIDSYLLGELGIALPPKNTQDLQSRIYFTKLSHISGHRFDAEYHQHYYTALQTAIHQGKYQTAKIRDLMDNVKDLSQPFDDKVIYVEIGDIEVENAVIDLKTMLLEKLPSNTKICIKRGDLLISTVRPNRKAVAIYENNNTAYCTSAFCVLRENGKYKKELLQYLLRTNIFNALIVRNTTGSTYPTINNSDILNLKIPLPPLPVQKKIADEIIKHKQKALNLQKEAKNILKSAKIQVEKIIVGEK